MNLYTQATLNCLLKKYQIHCIQCIWTEEEEEKKSLKLQQKIGTIEWIFEYFHAKNSYAVYVTDNKCQ